MADNYFSPETDHALFYCTCGRAACAGPRSVSQLLLDRLNFTRAILKEPIVVTSGPRCPEHNAEVGGVDGSQHVNGEAADIRVEQGVYRFAFVQAALLAGITRLGIGASFIHVDVGTTPVDRVMWTYYNSMTGQTH